MQLKETPSGQAISVTHERIKPYIHRTPILTNTYIDQLAGCNIHFKCENFQKVGAFKARGGVNAILSLSEEEVKRGVATHSSGNHAQAVAYAAGIVAAKAYIVMPESATAIKKAAVEDYGGEVITCDSSLEARELTLQRVVEKTGAVFLHPYNDYRVIAGQATCAKELLEDLEMTPDVILTPVGGGGLLSGTALSAHYFSDHTKVIGTEPEGADDAWRSFTTGQLIPQTAPDTIADGLRTSLGEKPFGIIQKHVSDILLVNDKEIVSAMRLVWERMKIIIEPSCAVPVAALLKNRDRFAGQHVAIVFSGGNVDLTNLPFN
ncbi:threonine/serine dehydratase [Fulvivirga sp. M361]|uniref:threonine ammonia-lyase n=1 Tax=Fulvivirga sp. M361 TaxID=2594266 RepID=UPI00117BD964|nr:threonine/serine dehydratase [Fulvivirga sp. M361]TRX62576.1 threonine/serine dehydratase [Fulvivirga sp. M361]